MDDSSILKEAEFARSSMVLHKLLKREKLLYCLGIWSACLCLLTGFGMMITAHFLSFGSIPSIMLLSFFGLFLITTIVTITVRELVKDDIDIAESNIERSKGHMWRTSVF